MEAGGEVVLGDSDWGPGTAGLYLCSTLGVRSQVLVRVFFFLTALGMVYVPGTIQPASLAHSALRQPGDVGAAILPI